MGNHSLLIPPQPINLNQDDRPIETYMEKSIDKLQDNHSIQNTFHQEAYYLYFVAVLGILLNLLVVLFVFIRQTLRKMTSAFLIHACFLDCLKAAYCIPIANNLVTQQKPADCDFFGATYVLIVTASIFNMLAMVCTEAYTFGEINVGGNSRGSLCCILFGIILVYIASTVLHLGPTLIGGYFDFHPEIGSCSFVLGKETGYVAHAMWIAISTLSIVGIIHFICRLYKEIQVNHTNRVSMLVRSSLTITDDPVSSCDVQNFINDSSHRAKIFILSTISFVICWYPLFLLLLIDVHFKVSPKVYQSFSFIAWTQGSIQPMVYILFDRHINLLAKYVYCDRYRQYRLTTIANLMNQQISTASNNQPTSAPCYDIEDHEIVFDPTHNENQSSTHSTSPSTMLQMSHESTPLSNIPSDERDLDQEIGLPC